MPTSDSSPWIKISSGQFALADFLAGNISGNSDFENRVLEFCRRWLTGQDKFEIQTSGSTGVPKKIHFARKQLEASARLTEKALGLKTGYTALVCLDAGYIAGQMMLVRCLTTKMNIIAVEPSANPFAHIPSQPKIDFAALVPYQVQAIVQSAEAYRFNEIKTVIIGGASIPPSIIEKLQPYAASFYATYGMTETISHIALQRLNGAKQNSFYPLNNITLSTDQRGCLEIFAPHVSHEKIVTNDVVELQDDQSFHVVGRWDNVINSGGVKLIPEKIERVISESIKGYHSDFFVGGIPDERLGEKLVLVFEGGPQIQEKEFLLSLATKLGRFEIPKEICFVKEFVRTETGKINRKETLNLLLTR